MDNDRNYDSSGKKCVAGPWDLYGDTIEGCTKRGWHTYWCPTEFKTKNGSWNFETDKFSDCATSCIDQVFFFNSHLFSLVQSCLFSRVKTSSWEIFPQIYCQKLWLVEK